MEFATAVVDLARRLVDGDDVWEGALAALDRYVGGDVLSISSMTFAERSSADLVTRGATPLGPEEVALWERLVGTHPYVPRLLRGPVTASRLSDSVSLRAFERTELYQALLRPHGNRYQAGLVLQRGPDSMLLASVWRADADFSDQEMHRLEQIRSVLAAAVAYRAACDDLLRDAQPGHSAPAGAGGVGAAGTELTDNSRPRLTARQQQVAALVASGLTNDQIARRLSISARTVRKHMGDLFERSGADSRAGLTAWWCQGG